MPANLSPEYRQAEERFRKAGSIEDKIACLEEMLRTIPKHKGTEKLQADIKTRLSKFRRQPQKKGGTRAASHMVPREGAGQVALVGPPNSGKSALVRGLTHATPEVADYPFTTREPVPGMMRYKDIAFQLLDLPPLAEEHVEPWLYDLVRAADLLWLVVEPTNSLDELLRIESMLEAKKIKAYPAGGEEPVSASHGCLLKPALLVVACVDQPGGKEDIEILEQLLEEPWPVLAVSVQEGTGLDKLGQRTFEALDLVRVYTKQPGKPADREQPFALPRGATVGDLARTIHKEVLEGFKFAKIWGSGAFDGQTVQRDHVLVDGDVIELHS